MTIHIRESVDSLCRDSADTPLSLNKSNGSELSNVAAISPFRHITWPTSVFIHDKKLKGDKIHRYSDIREIAKTVVEGPSINSSPPLPPSMTVTSTPYASQFYHLLLSILLQTA